MTLSRRARRGRRSRRMGAVRAGAPRGPYRVLGGSRRVLPRRAARLARVRRGGAGEPAARAARAAGDGLLERVAVAGAAGHVLDFDDTYLPGVAHLSAPTAPAALVVAAAAGTGAGDALDAYAAGFEARARCARQAPGALRRRLAPDRGVRRAGRGRRRRRVCSGSTRSGAPRQGAGAVRGGRAARRFGSDGKALVGPGRRRRDGSGEAGRGRCAGAPRAGRRRSGRPRETFGGVYAETGGGASPRSRTTGSRRTRAACRPTAPSRRPSGRASAAPAAAGGDRGGRAPGVPAAARSQTPRRAGGQVLDPLRGRRRCCTARPTGTIRRGGAGRASPRRAGGCPCTPTRAGRAEAVLRLGGREAVRVDRGAWLATAARWTRRSSRGKLRDLAGERLDGVLDDPGRPAAEVLAAAGRLRGRFGNCPCPPDVRGGF